MVNQLYLTEKKLEKESEVTKETSSKTHCHETEMSQELGKSVLLSANAIEAVKQSSWDKNKEREVDYER
ncbi:hypothetical protein SAMN06297422_10728 [Lachnospiraceae bacterium]|nr:hypothetical protein SAMN06297422_10728 [Lachnospiraceae bacterium]